MDEFRRLLFRLPARRECTVCGGITFDYTFFQLGIDFAENEKPPVREFVAELMVLCRECKPKMWLPHLYHEHDSESIFGASDALTIVASGTAGQLAGCPFA